MDLGFLTATDLADYLTRQGVAFRDAHHITGKIISYCETNDKSLDEIKIEEFKKFSKLIEKDIYKFISINHSISSKNSYGGTSINNVKKMVLKYKKILSKL